VHGRIFHWAIVEKQEDKVLVGALMVRLSDAEMDLVDLAAQEGHRPTWSYSRHQQFQVGWRDIRQQDVGYDALVLVELAVVLARASGVRVFVSNEFRTRSFSVEHDFERNRTRLCRSNGRRDTLKAEVVGNDLSPFRCMVMEAIKRMRSMCPDSDLDLDWN
jgi:hypothetical protein